MRIEKRKKNTLYGLKIENNREVQDTEKYKNKFDNDIDWTRTKYNYFLIKNNDWSKYCEEKISENNITRRRKDEIIAIDSIYTASPNFFKNIPDEKIKQYFQDCLKFHVENFCQNDKNLVINAVVHLDETTPHLHILSIPILRDEKGAHLSAKLVCGNSKNYQQHQQKFFEKISQKYGLERGQTKQDKKAKQYKTLKEYKKITAELQAAKATEQAEKTIKSLQSEIDTIKTDKTKIEIETIEAKKYYEKIKSEITELYSEIDKKKEEIDKLTTQQKAAENTKNEATKSAIEANNRLNSLIIEIEETKAKRDEITSYKRKIENELSTEIKKENDLLNQIKSEQTTAKENLKSLQNELITKKEEIEKEKNKLDTEFNEYRGLAQRDAHILQSEHLESSKLSPYGQKLIGKIIDIYSRKYQSPLFPLMQKIPIAAQKIAIDALENNAKPKYLAQQDLQNNIIIRCTQVPRFRKNLKHYANKILAAYNLQKVSDQRIAKTIKGFNQIRKNGGSGVEPSSDDWNRDPRHTDYDKPLPILDRLPEGVTEKDWELMSELSKDEAKMEQRIREFG